MNGEERGRSGQFAYLDLLATTLTEHEKNLDSLIRRLEKISESVSRISRLAEPEKPVTAERALSKGETQETLIYMRIKINRPTEELKLVLETLKE